LSKAAEMLLGHGVTSDWVPWYGSV